MKPKHWLLLCLVAGGAAESAACSSSFHSCNDSRTCAPTAGAAGLGDAGDNGRAPQAGAPDDSGNGGQPDVVGAGAEGGEGGEGGTNDILSQEPILGLTCTSSGALACNGAAQKLRLLCDSGTWHANGTCSADENCDQTSGVCAAILTQCKGESNGSVVCGTGEVVEKCGPDLVTDEVLETCTGKCVSLMANAECAPTSCGDGKIESPEQCDDGNAVNTDDCTNACKSATCGDGALWAGHEQCDDGNVVSTDACTNACKISVCGDGFVWEGHEECDDGNAVNTDACTGTCKNATCGDGITWANHEECDDGNAANTDACISGCKVATCGDKFVQAGKEQCDSADSATLEFCSRTCNTTTWALWPMPNPVSTGLPHAASYDTSKAGVVTDNVTNLMWQRTADPGTYTWAAAKAYCANLTLGGFSDWRTPTRIELVSIYDPTLQYPNAYINNTAFPGNPNSPFWTSSVNASDASQAWIVDFGGGQNYPYGITSSLRVRCAR
jgi:cysteine-rich repeat protein